MLLFAVAHAVQLEDGTYAVRSPEFPGCEARSAHVEVAREQFGEALRERLLEMVEAGEVPSLSCRFPRRTASRARSTGRSRCARSFPPRPRNGSQPYARRRDASCKRASPRPLEQPIRRRRIPPRRTTKPAENWIRRRD